jgi:hypothetical protein
MQLDSAQLSAALRSALAGVAGGVLYSGWAFYMNYDHGAEAARTAAITQGLVSFSITFVITAIMEGLSRFVAQPAVRFLVSSIGGITLAGAYTIGMHVWMETPEVLKTAAPSLLIGSACCCVYSAGLARPKPFQLELTREA